MTTYSIKDLEHLSGIKAHTLRIWEQRYNFIKPKRTGTNIRFYDAQDLKLILNISFLKDQGHKISAIARMSSKSMHEEVLRFSEKNLRYPEKIHALTLAMVDLDEDRFEKAMATSTLQMGFESTMINIIYPFLSKIGSLWQTGNINPAQEHFVANLLRQKLFVAIDGQVVVQPEAARKYMLFLPEGEFHEIGLLFACFLIKARNNKVIYLGQSLPFTDLEIVYEKHKPEYLFTVVTTNPNQYQIQAYIHQLSERFPRATILITGFQVIEKGLHVPDNVLIFDKIKELLAFLPENSMANF